mmetsp:Transcript_14958/g.28148  ORF Transcript_14958/g.28148 Transcript_14958/m.28148 type:complete len:83 (+) Transcript_14958:535-783(+)
MRENIKTTENYDELSKISPVTAAMVAPAVAAVLRTTSTTVETLLLLVTCSKTQVKLLGSESIIILYLRNLMSFSKCMCVGLL